MIKGNTYLKKDVEHENKCESEMKHNSGTNKGQLQKSNKSNRHIKEHLLKQAP